MRECGDWSKWRYLRTMTAFELNTTGLIVIILVCQYGLARIDRSIPLRKYRNKIQLQIRSSSDNVGGGWAGQIRAENMVGSWTRRSATALQRTRVRVPLSFALRTICVVRKGIIWRHFSTAYQSFTTDSTEISVLNAVRKGSYGSVSLVPAPRLAAPPIPPKRLSKLEPPKPNVFKMDPFMMEEAAKYFRAVSPNVCYHLFRCRLNVALCNIEVCLFIIENLLETSKTVPEIICNYLYYFSLVFYEIDRTFVEGILCS